jgi:hypothetical protein
MKNVEDMTLKEIAEHRKINEEIETRIGCKQSTLEVFSEDFGEFTDLNGKYVIVRTNTAGVFSGVLKARSGKEVELANARRLWYWAGAASLSQMANDGVKKSNECKFAQPLKIHQLTEAIEILPCTEAARKNIEAVPVWQQ